MTGTPKFTHASYDDFRVLTANVAAVSFCLFADPELARVGLNEIEAEARGIGYRLFKLPIASCLGRARLWKQEASSKRW
jgi:pyruvate/2-oxoglutarate dehydrogenase complex dihydrolipoamide dehydrogenase (E3) component